MQVNRINKISNYTNINFRNENTPTRDINSQNAILMLRDSNASIKFQHSQDFAQNADSVDTNPLKALGYKLYRTFSMIKNHNETTNEEANKSQFNAVA